MKASQSVLTVLTLLTVLAPAAVPAALAQVKLQIKPDRQNVVAGRIVGEWEPDPTITTRLGGNAPAGASNSVDPRVGGRVSIKSDPTIVDSIPAETAAEILKQGAQVFMSGTVTFGGTNHPFLLVSHAGNMMVLYFRPRRGDRYGDGESFICTLAPAKEPLDDLLFIGGDFNNAPFSAFKRVPALGSAPLAPLPQ
jgi:hypothetical protein